MAGLQCINNKNQACGDGRDYFMHFDPSRRGGKWGEPQISRFLARPTSNPPKYRRPLGEGSGVRGEAGTQHLNVTRCVLKTTRGAKERIEQGFSDMPVATARSSSLSATSPRGQQLLTPRLDPALDSQVPFQRSCGHAASVEPQDILSWHSSPRTPSFQGAESQAFGSPRSWSAMRAAAIREGVPPHTRRAKDGTSRTGLGGFWSVSLS